MYLSYKWHMLRHLIQICREACGEVGWSHCHAFHWADPGAHFEAWLSSFLTCFQPPFNMQNSILKGTHWLGEFLQPWTGVEYRWKFVSENHGLGVNSSAFKHSAWKKLGRIASRVYRFKNWSNFICKCTNMGQQVYSVLLTSFWIYYSLWNYWSAVVILNSYFKVL